MAISFLYNLILMLQIRKQEKGYCFSVKFELMLTVISKRILGVEGSFETYRLPPYIATCPWPVKMLTLQSPSLLGHPAPSVMAPE